LYGTYPFVWTIKYVDLDYSETKHKNLTKSFNEEYNFDEVNKKNLSDDFIHQVAIKIFDVKVAKIGFSGGIDPAETENEV
jgi:hypothetical protein